MKKSILSILMTITVTVSMHAQDSISVLFIGNSYTYVNDLAEVTKQLAASMGKVITTGSKTNGGYSFSSHYGETQTFTAMRSRNWDVVVLQDQSQMPAFPDQQVNTQTIPFAMRLADSVYAINPCSNVLFYMTWGRENGDPQWEPISTFDGMNQRLYNAYMRMADSTDGMVSPVGAVWKYVRDHHPSIQLYSGDGSHPSMAGTYLAACTFYTSLFRTSVAASAYTAGLDPLVASQLRIAADAVVLDSLEHFKVHPVNEPVTASFTSSQEQEGVQFVNTSLRDDEAHWYFGDGAESQELSPFHVYSATGIYTAKLIASNGCTSDTLEQSVIVETIGLNEPVYQLLKEFPDHFEMNGLGGGYSIYSMDGRLVEKGPLQQHVFKPIVSGIMVVQTIDGQLLRKRFVKW